MTTLDRFSCAFSIFLMQGGEGRDVARRAVARSRRGCRRTLPEGQRVARPAAERQRQAARVGEPDRARVHVEGAILDLPE